MIGIYPNFVRDVVSRICDFPTFEMHRLAKLYSRNALRVKCNRFTRYGTWIKDPW